jgi:excisionase family DNA binding protein
MEFMATWLTVKQLAKYLQVSEAKIYTMARAKELPASRLGNQWRFDQARIDSWLASGRLKHGKG